MVAPSLEAENSLLNSHQQISIIILTQPPGCPLTFLGGRRTNVNAQIHEI